MSSADNLWRQIVSQMVFPKEFFEKVDFEKKISRQQKNRAQKLPRRQRVQGLFLFALQLKIVATRKFSVSDQTITVDAEIEVIRNSAYPVITSGPCFKSVYETVSRNTLMFDVNATDANGVCILIALFVNLHIHLDKQSI